MEDAPIRAAVFDLGNTLWFAGYEPSKEDADRMVAELLRPWLATTGVTLPAPVEVIVREVWDAFQQAWDHEFQRGTHHEPSVPFLVRGALAVRGLEVTPEFAEEWHVHGWLGSKRFGVELYPDALDVLRALRSRGVLIGINSNRPCTTAMMMRDLAEFDIALLVDAAVSSGETGFQKPHPSTFEYIIEALGVGPHEAVMVGDSCEADMRGARAVGMRTVLKLNGRYGITPCENVDFAVHELGELLGLPIFDGAKAAAVPESLTPHDDGNEDRY
jgi:HAD superfamily hydrolase (TIGR01509 family)